MSDEDDAPTFWFKCPRGHVEERPWPPEDGLTLCDAQVVKAHEHASGIYYDRCGEEMRHFGPTVAEWRAMNVKRVDAEVAAGRAASDLTMHQERLLVEADAALAACTEQLEEARAQLDSAEREAEHWRASADAYRNERDEARGTGGFASVADLMAQLDSTREELWSAEQAAMLNQAAAQREAHSLRERDAARRDRQDQVDRLSALRGFLLDEAMRADAKGRVKLAGRLRGARSASWSEAKAFEEFGSAVIPGAMYRSRTADFGRPAAEVLGEYRTEPLTLDSQARRIADLEAELRKASDELRKRKRASQGFTVVRDVNAQTAEALRVARAALSDAQAEERNARCEVCSWQLIALWAAKHDPIRGLPTAAFQQRCEVLMARYEADMEREARP